MLETSSKPPSSQPDRSVIQPSESALAPPPREVGWGESLPSDARPHKPTRYIWQVIRTTSPLLLADWVALAIGFAITLGTAAAWNDRPINHQWLFFATAALAQAIVFLFVSLYPGVGMHPAVELRRLTLSWAALASGSFVFAVIQGSLRSPYAGLALGTYTIALFVSPIIRTYARGWAQRKSWWGYPAVFVGGGPLADGLYRDFQSGNVHGIRLYGRFDSPHNYWREPSDNQHVAWLGGLESVVNFAKRNQIRWLILTVPSEWETEVSAYVHTFRRQFRHIVMVYPQQELPSLWNRPLICGGLAAVNLEERLMMAEQRFLKRLLDWALIAVSSVVLLPLVAALAIAILVTSGRPVLYCNPRIGRAGRTFGTWKFRTMVRDAESVLQQHLAENPEARREFELTHKLKNDPRITPLGRMLRKTSLDELPQIWNVLVGDMSLVGPRPIQKEELKKYGDTLDYYLRVRPGITGMWQISGRNNTTYEERLRHDRFYVRNWSPWLDLYILGRTVKTVLKCEGAY